MACSSTDVGGPATLLHALAINTRPVAIMPDILDLIELAGTGAG
jgi:hypothetical protein